MNYTSSINIRVPVESELTQLPRIESLADAIYLNNRFAENIVVCSIEELNASLSLQLLYIADFNGEIVGFVMSRMLGKFAHLQQLSVMPDHGKKGIGSLLLKKMIEQVSLKNYPEITLTTFSDVRWNAPFYRKWGFVEVNDYTDYPELQQIHESEKMIGLENRVGMTRKLRGT